MSDAFPAVTAGDDWQVVDRTAETVFRLPTAVVRGHTVVYGDPDLSAAVRAAGVVPSDSAGDGGADDAGDPWRFVFATRLSFSPPLPPGIGPASVYGVVASEAASEFVDRLRDRGFEDVSRGRTERVRVDGGQRARLRKYTATLRPDRIGDPDPGDGDGTGRGEGAGGQADPVDVEGWTGLWVRDGEFLLAGGAFPRSVAPLLGDDSRVADLATDPADYREELLRAIRSVE